VRGGVSTRAIDEKERTSLHWAALGGHKNIVEFLIGQGADVNARDQNGETPLPVAAVKGHKDVVEYLVEKGADVNTIDNYGSTALHVAALIGHKDIVEFLVGRGADVNARDNSGRTALDLAKEFGRKDVVEFLVGKGADATLAADTKVEDTSLHLAARSGKTDVLTGFFKAIAVAMGFLKTVADVKAAEQKRSISQIINEINLLPDISTEDQEGYTSQVIDNIKLSLGISTEDREGYTTLYRAAKLAANSGDVDGFRNLVEENNDLILGHESSKSGFYNSMEQLWKKAIQVRKEQPFQAARSGKINIIKDLLEKGADVNARDNDDKTVLHLAAENGYMDVVEYLLEKGINVDAKDDQGRTALDLANKFGHTEGANAILEAVAKKPSTQVSGTQEEQHTAQAGASKS
jgi:ankyrin repeat protein